MIRKSMQFIMINIKMTSKFDDAVEARERALIELLKWPKNQLDCFPKMRLFYFFSLMTISHKQELENLLIEFKRYIGEDPEKDHVIQLLREQIQFEYFMTLDKLNNQESEQTKKGQVIHTTNLQEAFDFLDIVTTVERRKKEKEEAE